MLTWQKGLFDLDPPEEREFPNEMNASVQEILMEGMRQLDEFNRIREELPDLAGAHRHQRAAHPAAARPQARGARRPAARAQLRRLRDGPQQEPGHRPRDGRDPAEADQGVVPARRVATRGADGRGHRRLRRHRRAPWRAPGAQRGATVVLSARDERDLDEVAREVRDRRRPRHRAARRRHAWRRTACAWSSARAPRRAASTCS